MVTIFNSAALLSYGIASGWLIYLIKQKQLTQQGLLLALSAVAILFHGIGLYFLINLHQGFDLTIQNTGSLILWTINSLVLLSSIRKPLHNLFIVLFPLSLVVIGISILPGAQSFTPKHVSPGIGIHVLLSIVAYSLLAMAAIQSLIWHWQNQKLRQHNLAGLTNLLPPLQTMEALIFELLLAGQLLLTLGIVIGAVFIENIFAQHLVHKTVLTIVAWFVFSALLVGRHRFGWRGNKAVKWVLSGFCLLMLAYFGSKFVLEVILYSK